MSKFRPSQLPSTPKLVIKNGDFNLHYTQQENFQQLQEIKQSNNSINELIPLCQSQTSLAVPNGNLTNELKEN
jgi:hypothetical protein